MPKLYGAEKRCQIYFSKIVTGGSKQWQPYQVAGNGNSLSGDPLQMLTP
jgi:hypothetical protein